MTSSCGGGCTPGPYIPIPGPPGPPGPPTPGTGMQAIAAHDIGGHRLVVPLDDGTLTYASCLDPDHTNRPVWLTTSAWDAGELATVVAAGEVTEPSWAWIPGTPLFVGGAGLITDVVPLPAVFCRRVALPITPTKIWFDPDQPITLTPGEL